MAMLLVAASFDAALLWAILRMIGQAGVYESVKPAGELTPPPDGWPVVAIVVPARDEADVIGRCVAGLLAQDYPRERLSVTLVDDGSTDGTGEVARIAAAGDARLRIVPGGTLPSGWTGKAHACARGADGVSEDAWLCFMDADTRAEPGLLRAAVAEALRRRVGLLSLEPFQELGSPIERLVVPCGLYLVAATGDHAAVNAPGDAAAAANGQFMLFAPGAYTQAGGHAAVRGAVCEDLALAWRAKRASIGFALLGAEALIRTRMYRDAPSLWHGLSKNVTALGGGTGRTLVIAAGGLATALLSLVLPSLALAQLGAPTGVRIAAAVLAVGGFSAVLGLHVAGARHFRIPAVYGLAYPIGYALAFALAANAARLRRLGRVRWKDRTVTTQAGAEP